MFKQDVTTTYNLTDATYEIVIMLLVAFILGYFLRYFSAKKSTITVHTDEAAGLLLQLGKTQTELEKSIQEKAELKKNLTLEYANQIEELKLKLNTSRVDLEQCLASKAEITKKESSKKVTVPVTPNDLKVIEGIGPALAKILNQAGIDSYLQMAQTSEETLRQILSNAGSRFKVHDPSTWPAQAKLATEENWEELKIFQERLNTVKTD
ncbi:MAG: hypothetical protein ACKVQB_07710 [Bacteroidia bacterium]